MVIFLYFLMQKKNTVLIRGVPYLSNSKRPVFVILLVVINFIIKQQKNWVNM